jgi:hypothetical protein
VTNHSTDTLPLVYARVAGLLGLLMLVTGSFGIFVHTKLVVPGDAETDSQEYHGFGIAIPTRHYERSNHVYGLYTVRFGVIQVT